MTYKSFIAVLAGSVMALGGAGYAQTKSAPAKSAAVNHEAKSSGKPMTSATRGTIKSISDNQIVIERKTKDGAKDMTLVLNPATQKTGDLKVGAPVSVHYRFENNADVATSVRVETAKKTKGAAR